MATSEADTEQKHRIIIHGNIGFGSSQFLMLLPENESIYLKETKEELEFFPFSDLSKKFQIFQANSEMKKLIEQSGLGVEVSAILVLISLTEIYSEGMHKIMQKLPQDNFYGFDKSNEKEWWSRVIVVFSFERDSRENDSQVKMATDKNGGIKDIVKKAGDRFFWISNETKSEDLIEKLSNSMLLLNGKLAVGETHSEGYPELAQSFEKYFPASSSMCTRGNLDKIFVLIGESKSGKSSLGNLLLGPRDKPLFETGWYIQSSGKEKRFLVGDAEIELEQICPDKWKGDSPLKIQIIDGPDKLKPKQYGQFLADCTAELRKTTFLILINLRSGSLSHQEFIKITDISRIFSSHKLDLFSKSMIVFTHVDELIENNEDPEPILRKFLLRETYSYVRKLISLVNQRYIWINGTNLNFKNRHEVLRQFFQAFSSETLNDKSKDKSLMLINYQAMANVLQKLFDCDKGMNTLNRFCLNDIEIEMREVLEILRKIGRTKVRVIMINFKEERTEIIYDKLLHFFKDEDWNCALIAFTVQFGIEDLISEDIPKRFSILVKKVDSRYIFLTEEKFNYGAEKHKSTLNQGDKSTHSDVSEREKNDNSVCKEKFDYEETSGANQNLESKVFLSHNAVFSSNEPNDFLFSYFMLDEIAD